MLLTAATPLVLSGCERQARERDGIYTAEVGRVPAARQRAGDPEKGRDALLNRSAMTCGIPYAVYRATYGAPALSSQDRVPGRTGRNRELPYGLTATTSASGVELVATNCLGCHAAVLEDELVIGLGNELLDMTQDPLLAVEATRSAPMSPADRAEWQRWAERTLAVADYGMTETVGVSSADNLTMAAMAHHSAETLAWSARPLIEPPPERPVSVSVPPLWNLRKKHALFYNAEGRGDQAHYLALAATLCTDSVEDAAAIDAWLVDVRAYLSTLEAPAYPFPIDPVLAERGEHVFRSACQKCHGSYGDDARYPNKVIALGVVKTDPVLARQRFSATDRFRRWFQGSFYGDLSWIAPALGYIAPPLDGVWATAPYLHNGSVPSLELLLDSRSRPVYWELDREAGERPVYDQQHVGWAFRVLEQGKAGAMSWDERNRIYDTTLPGYGNGGHDFGGGLTSAERRALLEYLKTL